MKLKKYGKIGASVILCALVAVLLTGIKKGAAEDNIIHAGQSGDLTWEVDSNNRLTVTGSGDYNLIKDKWGDERPPWEGLYIEEAVFRNIKNITSLKNCFFGMGSLRKVKFSNVDTTMVTDMSGMFRYCNSLEEINWGDISTVNVKDMSYMFADCDGYLMQSLDLTSFDTGNVTNMSHMFSDFSYIVELDLSSFNTSNVTDMSDMFAHVGDGWIGEFLNDEPENWVKLDVSNFDTSKVTDMSGMFAKTVVKELDLSNFNTSSVTNMSKIFYMCLCSTLNLTSFDTSNIRDMSYMFECCINLKNLDLSNFNTSSVTNMRCMFEACDNLEKLDLSSFDTSSVTDMSSMFNECSGLKQLNLLSFDTHNVISMNLMFWDCANISELDLSSFDLSGLSNEGLYGGGDTPNFSGMLSLKRLHSPKVVPKETFFDTSEEMSGFYRSDTGELLCTGYWPECNGQSILLVTEDLLDPSLRPNPDHSTESPNPGPTGSSSPVPEQPDIDTPTPIPTDIPTSEQPDIVTPTPTPTQIPSSTPAATNIYKAEGIWTGWGEADSYPSAAGHEQGDGTGNTYDPSLTNMVVSSGYLCGLELMNPYNPVFTGADNEMAVFINKMKQPVIRVTLKNGGTASGWNWSTELSFPSGKEVSLTKDYLKNNYFVLFGNDDAITKVEIYDAYTGNETEEPATATPKPTEEPSDPTLKPTLAPVINTSEPISKPTQTPGSEIPEPTEKATASPAGTGTTVPSTDITDPSAVPNQPSVNTPVPFAKTSTPSAIRRNTYKVKAPSRPAKGKIKKGKALRGGKVKLTWKRISGAYKYQIQYCTKRSFAGKKTISVYGKSMTLFLKPKKTYYIRIRAVKYGNSATYYRDVKGNWSAVKKIKTK